MEELSIATASKLSSLTLDPQKDREEEAVSRKSSSAEETLWVDRYRPRKFTDLLGNERVARETLAWVKHWDWCVFGRNGRGKAMAGGSGVGAGAMMANRKRTREGEVNNDQNGPKDEFRRPREKVGSRIVSP
jgi:chromosome transmission fidelity protein 18